MRRKDAVWQETDTDRLGKCYSPCQCRVSMLYRMSEAWSISEAKHPLPRVLYWSARFRRAKKKNEERYAGKAWRWSVRRIKKSTLCRQSIRCCAFLVNFLLGAADSWGDILQNLVQGICHIAHHIRHGFAERPDHVGYCLETIVENFDLLLTEFCNSVHKTGDCTC